MSTLDAQVPQPTSIVPTTPLGSRAARFGAVLLDGIIVVIPIFIVAAAAGDSVAGPLGLVLWIAATVLYAPLLMAREGERNGQTLGKQALGLRVVTTAGVPVTFGTGIKRHLLGQTVINMFTFGFYSLLDYAWALWDDRKQTLHDKIANTYVFAADADPTLARELNTVALPGMSQGQAVSTPPPPPPPPGIPTG